MTKLPIHRAAKPKIKDKITRGLGNLPLVEIVRPWRGYAVGARIRPPGTLRQVLVDQRIAVLVQDKPKRGRPKKVVEEKVELVKVEPVKIEPVKPDPIKELQDAKVSKESKTDDK